MDFKNKSAWEIVQMIVATPDYRGIPVYEDATMPHLDEETGEEIHARLLKLPGHPQVLLCSASFFAQVRELSNGKKK